MAEKESIKTSFADEKAKFSKMDFSQKIQYFRDYYLVKLLIVLAILLAAGWLIHDIVQNKKVVYAGAGVGVNVTDNGAEYLNEGFIDYLGKSYSKKKASYGGNVLIVPQSGDYNQSSVEMAFISQINADMFQYLLITEKKYEHFSEYEFFVDLSTLSNFDKYRSSDILTNAQGKPEAIRLSDSMCEKLGITEEDVYLGFVSLKDHKELNEKMLDYLMA